MAKPKQMTVAIKSEIKTLKDLSWSNRKIAKKIGFSEYAVRAFLKQFKETGSFDRKKGSGRKRKTTARQDHLLKQICLKNRFAASSEIRKEFEQSTKVKISDRLVRRRLTDFGLISRRPARKPLLNERMRRQRREWAKDKKNWTIEDWQNVIFSDESKFNLMGPDGTSRVRRRKGERYSNECVAPTVKHSEYIMVWGCITSIGVGPLIILDGNVDTKKYEEIVVDGVIPAVEELSQITGTPIFQDDSAPCHRAKRITTLKECLGITSLQWPGNSPDLNPIENVWATMGKAVRQSNPENKEKLIKTVEKIWYEDINMNYIRDLYSSMPRRVKEVLKQKGGTTKY